MKLSETTQPTAGVDKVAIINWLISVGITDYTIRDNGIVDVDGDVAIQSNKIRSFPFQFGHVSGGFYCNYNELTSLAGAPQSVGRDFDCGVNKLTSLAGAPQSVGGSFYCGNNQLTSLVGAPQSIGLSFYCGNNELTSLVGAPQSIGGGFSCRRNKLTSLTGAPQLVCGEFYCRGNPQLKILPIFNIKGITEIYHEAGQILNKYYKPDGKGDIIAAQDELIDAGFGAIARMK